MRIGGAAGYRAAERSQRQPPAVTLLSCAGSYDDCAGARRGRPSTWPIQMEFRFSAAKAALLCIRSSKPQRVRRLPIGIQHVRPATYRSQHAKGNLSLNIFSYGKRAAWMYSGHGKVLCGRNLPPGPRRRRRLIRKSPAVQPGQGGLLRRGGRSCDRAK